MTTTKNTAQADLSAFLNNYRAHRANHPLMGQLVMEPTFREALLPHWHKTRFQFRVEAILAMYDKNRAISEALRENQLVIVGASYTVSRLHELLTTLYDITVVKSTSKTQLIDLLSNCDIKSSLLQNILEMVDMAAKRIRRERMIYQVPEKVYTRRLALAPINDNQTVQDLLERKSQTTDSGELRKIRAQLRKLGYFISKQ